MTTTDELRKRISAQPPQNEDEREIAGLLIGLIEELESLRAVAEAAERYVESYSSADISPGDCYRVMQEATSAYKSLTAGREGKDGK